MYERALVLLKKSTSAAEHVWMVVPTQLGLAWCLDQAGRTNAAIGMYRKGYQALSALDDNADGQLTGRELNGLAVLCHRNTDGIRDPGEVVPVEELGIQSISCLRPAEQLRRRIAMERPGLVFTNGRTRPTYDWVAPSAPHDQ